LLKFAIRIFIIIFSIMDALEGGLMALMMYGKGRNSSQGTSKRRLGGNPNFKRKWTNDVLKFLVSICK